MSNRQSAMEYIWERIPKLKGGKTIRYLRGDLDYLYTHGFVDSKNFTLEQWKLAFEPFKQKDESYILNRAQFLSLRYYRYTGPSDEVFDAVKIKEGPWTDADLQLLYDRSIGVASNVTQKMYWAYINNLKARAQFVDDQGRFLMSMPVKLGLDALLRKYPSPRTVLELEVQRIRAERGKTLAGNAKNRDASAFSVGQTEKETKQAALEKLGATRSVALKSDQAIPASNERGIDLKSLKKPAKTIKG